MKRILIVDQFPDLGGSQRGVLDLLPALSEFEIEFALPGPGAFPRELERRGIRWHEFPLGDYGFGRKSFTDIARYALRQPAVVSRLTELARGRHLVYANGPRVFPATALASRRAGIPLLWHLHLELESRRDRMLVEAAAALGNPRIIACSDAALAPFEENSQVSRRAVVVDNGAAPVSVPPHDIEDGPVIGAVGRLHPDKGLSELIEAIPDIQCAFPEARFRIVGPRVDEAYAKHLQAQAEELAPDSVDFAGETDDPGQAFAGIDLLVMPSRREAGGRVVIEACSAGIPVVASDAGGLREMVEGCGLVFPRGNSSALASAVIRVLLDPMLRRRMIEAGRENYDRRWGLERYRKEMLAEIQTQISPPPQGR